MSINLRDKALYEKQLIEYICKAHWQTKCDFRYKKKESYNIFCCSDNIECKNKEKSNETLNN